MTDILNHIDYDHVLRRYHYFHRICGDGRPNIQLTGKEMKLSIKQESKENVGRLLILAVAFSVFRVLSSVHVINEGTEEMAIHPTQTNDGLVVDIMSVGSKTRLDYQETQRNTFAKHKSVRFFFNITEDDDADHNCSDRLLLNDVYAIMDSCRLRQWGENSSFMRIMQSKYSKPERMKKRASPNGWMCAQTRPSHGFGKVIAQYRAMKETFGDAALPDYLFIADDDTYVNMELFGQYMSNFDTSIPRAVAGCLLRVPSKQLNFSFPLGGFGTILSKGKSPCHIVARNDYASTPAGC